MCDRVRRDGTLIFHVLLSVVTEVEDERYQRSANRTTNMRKLDLGKIKCTHVTHKKAPGGWGVVGLKCRELQCRTTRGVLKFHPRCVDAKSRRTERKAGAEEERGETQASGEIKPAQVCAGVI